MGPGGRTEHARVRALDGVRGLAVAGVLVYHSQLGLGRGGFLGVSAFFTLSGFLITSLLLSQSSGRGRVALRTFWARRARRLLPAAAVALAGVLVFGATIATADQLRTLRGDVLSTIGYAANWRFYFSGQSYAQLFSAPSPVLHFWSLAIEEQFYVVFPLVVALVLWVTRRSRLVLGTVLVGGIASSVLASRALYTSHGASRVYYGTDTRAAELLVGALLAVLVAGRVTPPRAVSTRVRSVLTLAGIGALSLMVWWWTTVDQNASWLYRGGLALHACCAAAVIAAARVEGPFARVLSWRPLAGLGRISYGVYLYHWPIFLWLSPERTGLATAPLLALRVGLTVAVAVASFVILEQPILHGVRPRATTFRFAIPATATVLVGGLLALTASTPAPAIVFTPLSSTPTAVRTSELRSLLVGRPSPAPPRHRSVHTTPAPPTVPLYRPFFGNRALRVLVVGDSVGVTVGRGLELWANATGRAIVQNDARSLCALGRTLRYRTPMGDVLDPSDSPCAAWGQTWPSIIASFDPDVVVVEYTIWEVESRQLPDGHWAAPGDPGLDRWQLGEYQAAADVLGARGAPVLWFNAGCEGAPIRRLDKLWYVDYRTIPALAASRRDVHVVDMNHLLCPDGQPNTDFGGVHDVRPDGAHFSDMGALAVARWLMPIVLGEQPAPPRIFPTPG